LGDTVDLSADSKLASPVFTVLDGPMTIKAEVLEYNDLAKWLESAANALGKAN
jgi:hypothetical protein